MFALQMPEGLFIGWAFLFQLALIVHFALRRWRFGWVERYGWVTYGLAVPATAVSLILLLESAPWPFWLGGFLCAGWALFAFTVEYIRQIEWRSPPRWSVFVPYLLLYLATIMFYWWPLGLLSRTLWLVYGGLFVVSTLLNVASHHPTQPRLHST